MSVIIGIINKIIDAMKSFIKNIEALGEQVITQLGIYSEKAASEIKTLMVGAFDKIKKGIERIITTFKDKAEQIAGRIRTPKIKSSQSILDKIENIGKEAFEKLSEITKNFGAVMGKFIDKTGEALKKISQAAEADAEKTYDVAKKIAEETVKKITEVGSLAIQATRKTSSTLFKEIEIAGNMAYKHGLAVSSASSLAFFDPYLAISLALSVGVIVAATKYEP